MLALALTGTVSIAAAGTAGYQSMAPTGQWYGQTFTGLPRGSRQLALTYDDGPNDPHTRRSSNFFSDRTVCSATPRYRPRNCPRRPHRGQPHLHAPAADLQK